ncbi:hypothetical protein A2U01_0064445, partial [Trifolium medium]|nr:hypothetical protein [Trifolium medium]
VEAVQDGSQKVRRRRGKQGRASTVAAGRVPVVDEGRDATGNSSVPETQFSDQHEERAKVVEAVKILKIQ